MADTVYFYDTFMSFPGIESFYSRKTVRSVPLSTWSRSYIRFIIRDPSREHSLEKGA